MKLSCICAAIALIGGGHSSAQSCNDWPSTCPGTLPKMKQSWMMNQSTIIMPCNDTGFTNPNTTLGWSIVDFDWSNAKGTGTADGWVKHKPMDDEEMLFKQVQMTTAATPGTTVWVYRCTQYGYPWYTNVRKILEDPAYSDWWLKFKPEGPWYSKKCDSANASLCSDYFHSQEQSPGYPHGDGDCAAPGCDCGSIPCGFYVWNHSSTTVVHGQTFQEWFIHDYILNEVGMSDLVSGFFWDDAWDANCRFGDAVAHTADDMGLTTAECTSITADYRKNMAVLRNLTIDAGKFSWQMMWTGGEPDGIGNTCPKRIINTDNCASSLREYCAADSPSQTRAMMYALDHDSATLPGLMQDLVNFLLIRGPYGWLGHGWIGCSQDYLFPPEFNVDYGVPSGLCKETAPNSGIFTRDFSKATVQMDCVSWDGSIIMK